MKYVIFGLPGSGKGLYSNYIEDITGAKQLSTGDLLRRMKKEDHSEIGDQLRKLSPTDFASDDIIIQAIKEELKNEIYANGVIFDGFPRTLVQAEKMVELDLIPDSILYVDCSEDVIKKRISGRRIHPESGRVYHIYNNPPKNDGFDDVTNEPLILRDDDKVELLEQRFLDFNNKTYPAFKFLKSKCKNGAGPVFSTISGEISPNEAYNELKLITNSINAIHKIRKDHSFTLVSIPYDLENKTKDDMILRESLHQLLMKGEIPFSPYIFYYQKNMLDPNISSHTDLVEELTHIISKKMSKLLVIAKTKNNKNESLIKSNIDGKDFYFTRENIMHMIYFKDQDKKISILPEEKFHPSFDNYKDLSENIDFIRKNINAKEIRDFLIYNNKDLSFVIIESPYAGNKEEIIKNENYARFSAIDCLNKKEIPFASHILYTQKGILDDTKPAQRRLGIEAGLLFGDLCSKTVLYSDLGMTEGMIEGIEKSKNFGKNIEIRNTPNFQDLYDKSINKHKYKI